VSDDHDDELALVHALADGELARADAERVRAHLATCAVCQAELADVMQLAALPPPKAPPSSRAGDVVALAWYRRRGVQVMGAAVAAAAGVAVWLATRPPSGGSATPGSDHGGDRAPQIALAAKRPLEARVSWGTAADYRDYDVPRAGEPAREAIPLAALADVEKTGDLHGVGVLELLDGDVAQAQSYLARAGDAPEVLADRAALALGSAQPQRALALADAALAARPELAAAEWNRGLALRELGLLRGAAAAFRGVAARHERGWSDEATRRAATLDAQADAMEQRFERLQRASIALASAPPGQPTPAAGSAAAPTTAEMSLDDARAEPGYARGILYDAIRSATTPARLDALRPLADAVDGADGDTAVAAAIARARAQLHPALSARYAAMIRGLAIEGQLVAATPADPPLPAGAARAQLVADLRAAHADDLLLGVLMKLAGDRDTVDHAELPEFVRLAAASPDPWMQMLGFQQQAQDALRRDDLIGAESILLRARAQCARGPAAAPAFRCILVSELLGDLYLKWLRLPDARAALADAWTLATRAGEWFLLADLLERYANLYVVDADGDGSDLPLVRAYTDEVVRRTSQEPAYADFRCQVAAWARARRAQVLVNRLDFAAARRELAGPRCKHIDDPAQAAAELFLRAELASQPGSGDDLGALRADIAALRATPQLPRAQQIVLDHAEGRAIIDRDPAAGEALLRRAIATAKLLPPSAVEARRTAAWSYAVLAIADARRGDGDAALTVLADEQELAAPATCVVGIAVDDRRRAIVARDAAGKPVVHFDEARTSTAVDPATLVPADLAGALASCREVAVIARPPVHGTSRLFADTVAWHYLSRRARPAGAASPGELVIADVQPPPALNLPRLQTWPAATASTQVLAGAQATPARVLAAIGTAGEVTVHAHGVVDAAQPDASYLALSPDADGSFALTTGAVHDARFQTSPLIVLAACQASQAAPVFHEAWSLPAAFVYAGARAVLASTAPIPDADAAAFFDAVRARVHAGASPTVALRDAREAWLADHRANWVRDVIVFE
jgi:hypothetical protein